MPETFDIVFRGGGVKGVAFIGALEKLVAAKHRIRRMIGTSVGAIFATSFAAGYTPEEMLKEIEKRDESDNLILAGFVARPLIGLSSTGAEMDWAGILKAAFNSDAKKIRDLLLPSLPLKHLTDYIIEAIPRVSPERKEAAKTATVRAISLLLLGGACDDRPFLDWMRARLVAKGAAGDITLEEFHKKFCVPKGQQLSLVATDLNAQEVLVLNHVTAPAVPVVDAVRMSMSIPYVWKEVAWKPAWKKYRDKVKNGNRIVDGGVLANFPIRYFLEARYTEKKSGLLGPPPKLDGQDQPARLLGLLLDQTRPATELEKFPPGWDDWLPPVQTTELLLYTLTDTWDLEGIREYFDAEGRALKTTEITSKGAKALCRIGTRGYSTLDFNLDKSRLVELVDRGRCGMDEFLKGR